MDPNKDPEEPQDGEKVSDLHVSSARVNEATHCFSLDLKV